MTRLGSASWSYGRGTRMPNGEDRTQRARSRRPPTALQASDGNAPCDSQDQSWRTANEIGIDDRNKRFRAVDRAPAGGAFRRRSRAEQSVQRPGLDANARALGGFAARACRHTPFRVCCGYPVRRSWTSPKRNRVGLQERAWGCRPLAMSLIGPVSQRRDVHEIRSRSCSPLSCRAFDLDRTRKRPVRRVSPPTPPGPGHGRC